MSGRNVVRPAARALACSLVALAAGWTVTPASAVARTLTSDDVAFGGQELAKPVSISGGAGFKAVLSINGVQFTQGEDARAVLNGVLSVKNTAPSGKVRVELRMAINGKPEAMVFSRDGCRRRLCEPFL